MKENVRQWTLTNPFACIVLLLITPMLSFGENAPTLFGFRAVVDEKIAQPHPDKYDVMELAQNGKTEKIFVEKISLLGPNLIKRATPRTQSGMTDQQIAELQKHYPGRDFSAEYIEILKRSTEQVEVELTPEGKQVLEKITREHLNQRLAIVLNGKVLMAPVVREPITGGVLAISSGDKFSKKDTLDLSTLINQQAGHK